MNRTVTPRLGSLIVALGCLFLGSILALTDEAVASPRAYDASVDITFPMAGTDYRFTDDYHHCRGAGCSRIHRATDIMAPYGVPINAAVGGTVSFITGLDGPPPSYGYMITIRGDDGRSYSYVHLGRQDGSASQAYAEGLSDGARVERGQHIGYNGCSGNASCSAPHLHFEINDPQVEDPYGTTRVNPFASLRAAEQQRSSPLRFRDVDSDDAHGAAIERVADAGITRGCNPPANDRFCPDQSVTRGQMAAFLVRSLGLSTPGDITFRDVPSDDVFARDIARLAEAGITRGCNPPSNDRFCPNDPVSREQMAAFLVRAFDLPSADRAGFADVGSDSTFAADIDRLAAAGITRGCNPPANDRYCPAAPVTRAEMASFLDRSTRR